MRKRKKKVYIIIFGEDQSLKEVYFAYSKKEARRKFFKDHEANGYFDDALKETIGIREISQEEFEKEFFGK